MSRLLPIDALLDHHQVYLARQPILDRAKRVFAYELLFRPTGNAEASLTQDDHATARVITDAVVTFGFDALTQGRPAFINVSRRLLVEGIPESLPPELVVIELLEDIEADDEVMAACRTLHRAGYSIALDDFVLTERNEPLIAVADYIKVDFRLASDANARRRLLELRRNGQALLAEKVETVEEYDVALAEGFDYFQGYFFGRPVTQGARNIPHDRVGHMRLLSALQDPDLTVNKLEELIQRDASLCYRVLRTVNSAAYGQRQKVESIRQALVLMGVGVLQRWLSLWALAGMGSGAHPELLVMSTVRARCCEILAANARGSASADQGFLLGLCSLLDVILEQPLPVLLEHLPLSAVTRTALLGEDNASRRLLDCAIACERGDWEKSLALAERAGINAAAVAEAHREAIRWSAEFQRVA